MEPDVDEKPWDRLRDLALTGDREALEALIKDLPTNEAVRALLRLAPEDQGRLLTTLEPGAAADLIEEVPDQQAADIVERLPAAEAASILQELQSDDQADLIAGIERQEAESILAELAPDTAAGVRRLAEYDSKTAGGLMMTEVFAFDETSTVRDVLKQLTSDAVDLESYHGQHPYVTSAARGLLGVVSLRNLLLARRDAALTSIMIVPLSVTADTALDVLENFFDQYDFLGVPVVDDANGLLGVVSRTAVAEAALERADADQLKIQGIVGDELRSMPLITRSRRRLSWLSINIVLNIIAASVIALYEETLTAVIALAVFLPIVSDMSGCSSNQAVAVSLRELTLGITKPVDLMSYTRKLVTA